VTTSGGHDHLRRADKGRKQVLLVFKTVAIGAAGGAVFAWLGTPLPWMLGALAATIACSMAGMTLYVYPPVRRLWIIVLGVMLGSSFTPEVLDHLHLWIVSFMGMVGFVVFGAYLSYEIFRRIGRIDRTTAFFCASPGGLGEMIILGPLLGGNERTIVLVHATRIVVVMAVVPPLYSLLAGYVPPMLMGGAHFFWEMPLPDLGKLALAGAIGAGVGRLVKLPAWQMTGPMVASAAVHMAGWTAASPPSDLVAVAQIVIGSSAGARFSGSKLHELVRPAVLSGIATLSLLATAVLAALGLAAITEIDFRAIHLALSPGGFAEMSLIALSLGIEVPFVSLHHFGRLVLVISVASIVAGIGQRRLAKRGQAPPKT